MDFEEVLVFFLLVTAVVCVFLIAIMLYHNFYIKSESKDKKCIDFLGIYLKVMIFWLGIIIFILAGKIGDDIIGRKYDKQYEELSLEYKISYDIDIVHCKRNFWIENTESIQLTTWQVAECKEQQRKREEHRKKESKIRQEMYYYKNWYRVGFISVLRLTHTIVYVARRKRKEKNSK